MYGQQRQFSTNRFGRGAIRLKAHTDEPLPLDMIAKEAPTVFAEGAHESRSARYAYIPTRAVLEGLWEHGFRPYDVRVGGSGDEVKRAFTKHMIKFRHVGTAPAIIANQNVGDLVNFQIGLLNSHDGTSAYKLFLACERVRCKNGLTADETFSELSIPHKGDVMDKVIEGAFTVVEDFPRLQDTFQDMAQLRLTGPQQQAFAKAAMQLRWEPGENDAPTAPIEPEEVLRVKRQGDEGADLWHVYNRVQEGIIRGGQRYLQRDENGRVKARREVKEVRSIDEDRRLNRALFTLAQELRAHVA